MKPHRRMLRFHRAIDDEQEFSRQRVEVDLVAQAMAELVERLNRIVRLSSGHSLDTRRRETVRKADSEPVPK